MKKPTSIGTNRTGIATSPVDSKKTLEGAIQSGAQPLANGHTLEKERLFWSSAVEPVGSMPPPASVKGAVKIASAMLEGENQAVFLDKLGERLAFERTGTRLYEALLCKLAAASVHQGGPTREELVAIRDDERRHFHLVKRVIEQIGGDPTVVTPSADIAGVASMGVVQVLGDPRSTLTQCLESIRMLELEDNDAWATLAGFATELGLDGPAAEFRTALQQEDQHLSKVRGWLSAALRGQAGLAPTPPR